MKAIAAAVTLIGVFVAGWMTGSARAVALDGAALAEVEAKADTVLTLCHTIEVAR